MTTLHRLLNMVLRGKRDQFNTVLHEELKERASIILEHLYKNKAKSALNTPETVQESVSNTTEIQLHLGNNTTVKLAENDQLLLTKLYESLNNDNKERMLKLLTESEESVNKVLNIARLKVKDKQ